MEDVHRIITTSGIKASHPALRIVERHVEKWILREQSLLFLPKKAAYSAHLSKEDDHYFTCHIEIRIGSQEWSGLDEGRSIQESVLNALRRLKRKEKEMESLEKCVTPSLPFAS